MGCYDEVEVPCPKCGEDYIAQSKSGPCELRSYPLWKTPSWVLEDVNRHAPFCCAKCGTWFEVELGVTGVHEVKE